MSRSLLVIATLAFMTCAVIQAQIPRQMSYQGLLTDPTGQLVPDGDHSLTMSLYTQATGGSSIWSETQTVTVVRGLFNVILGRGTPISDAVAFDRAYFLGVSVDGGAELSPRAALTASPYALRAVVADGLSPNAAGAVRSLNGGAGDMTLVGNGGTTVSRSGDVITISSSGGGGTGIAGVQNTDGSITITSPNGPIATLSVADGGVTPAKLSTAGATSGTALTYNGSNVVWGNPIGLLQLPYAASDNSSSTAFSISADGTGSAGSFSSTLPGSTSAALQATSASAGPALFAGNNATGSAIRAQINNGSSSAYAIEGLSNTNTATIAGRNTAATGGATYGVLGEAASTSHGVGANGGVSGVLGRVVGTTPGGYSAGVRGLNQGTAGTGVGVIGYQAGSGWGVYGETPSGFGVYGLTTNNTATSTGVRGETFSTNGIGVEAKYSGTGVGIALELDNGAIRVAGVNKAAFVHTATAANKLSTNGTDITNPMCDGDANAILIVTQRLNPPGIVYNNSPIGVYYNTTRGKWEIFNQNNVAIPNNAQFNVLVIKQ